MNMNDSSVKTIFSVFLIMVIALAFTPTIATMTTDSTYIQTTEYNVMTPSSSNSTTTVNTARNDSATYAYFTIVLNATNAYGVTAIDEATNITYTTASNTLTFKTGVLNSTAAYNVSITYYYVAMDTASQALVALVPLVYVITIVAVGVVTVVAILKRRT